MDGDSRIPDFYKKDPRERLEIVAYRCGLDENEKNTLFNTAGLPMETANSMIENVIGGFTLPLGIATNFRIDGEDYLIPMAVEEPSVVAAASNAAKMARSCGGFETRSDPPRMIGQVQVVDMEDVEAASEALEKGKERIFEKAKEVDPVLVKLGGGLKGIKIREIDSLSGPMIVVHLLVDCRDAMGANAVNTIAERVAPLIEEISGGKVLLRIISNLALHRLARAKVVFTKELLGEELIDNILLAYHFADADMFRAATHNKGIMNGISAVVRATGNDTRAIEAGAHAYAAMAYRYKPLTTYTKTKNGDLLAEIEIPMAVGLVGGATRSHPQARACVKIIGVKEAVKLGGILASVGLAQNFAALRALADEGIQRGHMKLHARNVAVSAGAKGDDIERVAAGMIEAGEINEARARELLKNLGE